MDCVIISIDGLEYAVFFEYFDAEPDVGFNEAIKIYSIVFGPTNVKDQLIEEFGIDHIEELVWKEIDNEKRRP